MGLERGGEDAVVMADDRLIAIDDPALLIRRAHRGAELERIDFREARMKLTQPLIAREHELGALADLFYIFGEQILAREEREAELDGAPDGADAANARRDLVDDAEPEMALDLEEKSERVVGLSEGFSLTELAIEAEDIGDLPVVAETLNLITLGLDYGAAREHAEVELEAMRIGEAPAEAHRMHAGREAEAEEAVFAKEDAIMSAAVHADLGGDELFRGAGEAKARVCARV